MKRIILILMIFSVFYLYSLSIDEVKQEIIELLNADSLVGSNLTENSLREFYGNIKLSHRDILITCNYAKQYLAENKADLVGKVIITQNTMVLQSPRITYHGNTSFAYAFDSVSIIDKKTKLTSKEGIYDVKRQIADFRGDVRIEDDSVRIFSDKVIYERKSRISNAFGSVFIKGKFTDVLLTADTVMNNPDQFYTFATSNPILFQIDTLIKYDSLDEELRILEFDTLSISSDTMEAFRIPSNEYYLFKGNVEIVRDEIAAKCSEAIYKKGEIILRQNPILWYGGTQLYADSIVIKIPNNQLDMIYSYNNSILVSETDLNTNNRFNQIQGKDIIIDIDNSKIVNLKALNNAKSAYYMIDDEGSSGLDKKETDTINVLFENGEVDKIIWKGSTEAIFYPEYLIIDDISTYNLPSFRWSQNSPQRKVLKQRN